MLLEVQNLSFSYGAKQRNELVLDTLNFTMDAGEVVGIVGSSGCGKSTFAKLLAGYERPSGGSILIQGTPQAQKGFHPAQLIYQHPEESVNPRWRLGRTLNEGGSVDEKLLKGLGIEKAWLARWPHELSGGELQRFCVARALNSQTRLLIADEISTMVDAITQAQLWELILETAAQRNMGVLVITHDNELATHICNRVVPFESLGRNSRGTLS